MLIALLIFMGSQQPGGEWSLVHQFSGSQIGEFHGFRVELIGDIDNDGCSEVLSTSPYLDLGDPTRLGAVSVYSGATGLELFRVTGLDFPDATFLGWSAASLGDVDLDGRPDFAFSAAGSAAWLPYSVFVYSGDQFRLIERLYGPPGSVEFGFDGVGGGHDLNGDGVPDVIVADDRFSGSLTNQGAVFAYDPLNWQAPLWSIEGSLAWELLGGNVDCVEDLNDDSLADVLVYSGISGSDGTVIVLSGQDGSELYRFTGPSGSYLGIGALTGIGDINGDNREDFAADQNPVSGGYGYVNIYSGIDGSLIHQLQGEAPAISFPGRIANVGDLDGDGFAEFSTAAGALQLPGHGLGVTYVYSSRDWAVMARIPGPIYSSYNFGLNLSGGEDVDGDGWPDLALSDYAASPNNNDSVGEVYVYSFDPYLRVSESTISASAGGQLTFDIQFLPSEAGQEYRLLISTDRPGSTIIGHLEIPLVATELTYAAIHDPRSWFMGTTGFLDSNGQATAVAQVAPGTLTSLIGKTIKLAAVSLRPPKKPTVSSAAVFVEVLP